MSTSTINGSRCISLFSGAGGLDIGFERAGFSTVSMCELEPQFAETLRQNQGWPHSDGHRYFADATILQNDIREMDAERLMHGETIDCVIIANCCLAGPEKFSPASLSLRESRRCRAFIREVAVKQIVADTTEPKLPIKESWLEYEYERYETLPVNKRTSGVRLCVSFEDNDDKLSRHYGVIKAVSPAKSVKDRRAVWSRGGVVSTFLWKERTTFLRLVDLRFATSELLSQLLSLQTQTHRERGGMALLESCRASSTASTGS